MLRWELDWLRGVPPSDPALAELANAPIVRNDGGKSGLFKIHRTLWPLLSEATRKRFPAPPEESVIDVPDDALRAYQKEAAKFCADRRGTLLALAMGCGKTRTALVAVGWGRGVVVAPLVAFKVWIKELQNVWGDLALWNPRSPTTWSSPSGDPIEPGSCAKIQVVRGHFKTGAKVLADADVYVVNPELLRTRWGDLASIQPDWVVFDEAHYYTNTKSQRQQGAAALANCLPNLRTIALTGTPILNHLTDLYGILNVTNPGGWGGWVDWSKSYCSGSPGEYGWTIGDPSNTEELRLRLREVMFARTWQEVMDDVPPITRELCPVILDDKQRVEYERLANDIREVRKFLDAGDLKGAEHMQQVNVLRRMVGFAKVSATQELIRSCGGEPVVVWTWHRDIAEAIAKPYKNALVVTGDEPFKKRDEKIDLFKNGNCNILVCTMKSTGFAVDLTRARITIVSELSWTPSDLAQAEARVFRSGQTKPCMTYWLVADDTIEAHIVDVLWEKAGMAAAAGKALGGDEKMMADVSRTISRETLRDQEIAASLMRVINKSFDLVGAGGE